MKDITGKDLADAAWLTTHFRARSSARFREISQLPIYNGDKILDIGCGPGIFGRYFSAIIGENGHIYSLDRDASNLDFAERQFMLTGLNNWTLYQGDFSLAEELCEGVNVVLMFNSICYSPLPEDFLAKLAKKLRKGSRIIVKDFDLSFLIFNPIAQEKWAELINCATRANNTKKLPYDNFFGRKIHHLHRCSDFFAYYNFTTSHSMSYPYSDSEKKYTWENIRSLIFQAGDDCSIGTLQYFYKNFNLDDGYFYLNPLSVFVENEFVTVLTV